MERRSTEPHHRTRNGNLLLLQLTELPKHELRFKYYKDVKRNPKRRSFFLDCWVKMFLWALCNR